MRERGTSVSSTDLHVAATAVAEACAVARRVQDEVVRAGESVTKDDRSPVTVADLAVQLLVTLRLARDLPGDALLAEESAAVFGDAPEMVDRVLEVVSVVVDGLTREDLLDALAGSDATTGRRRWVLDPVDGTKGFLRGDQYAIALALIEGDEVVAGVLGCPNLPAPDGGEAGFLFLAERGAGAFHRSLADGREARARVDEVREPAEAVVCESVESGHAAHSEQAEIARRLGIGRPPYRIDSQCKYAVLARGEASVYLRLPSKKGYREKVWDHAAGSIVIEEAGGRVTDLDGNRLQLARGVHVANPPGIVATNGHIHDEVLAAARAVLGRP